METYNRSFGKLNEHGNLEYAPSPLVVDGENIWTNIPETYLAQGYYPLIRTEMPEKEGFYHTSYWEQDGETIIQRWEEHKNPEPVEVVTEEELQAAIREGVNSIDS